MKLTFAILSVAALALSAAAQSAPPPPAADTKPATAEAAVGDLVLLPVQVQDSAGKPVNGLKQSDFVLQVDGKAQLIRVFSEVVTPLTTELAKVSARPHPGRNLKFSNLPDEGPPKDLLIIAIDLANTGFVQGNRESKQLLLRYVAENLPDQLVWDRPFELVAVTANGLVQLHSYRADSAGVAQSLKQVAAVLGKVEGDKTASGDELTSAEKRLLDLLQAPPVASVYGWEITARASLTALRQIAEAFAGVPGRKSVLWLTTGMRVMTVDPNATGMTRGSIQFQTQSPLKTDPELRHAYESAFRALNQADMAVYPVDLKELKGGKFYIQYPYILSTGDRFGARMEPGDGLKVLAAATGGQTCSAAASLAHCVDSAASDGANYYRLGFNVPPQQKAGWHKVEVKLTSGNGKLRSRSKYYLPAAKGPSDDDAHNYITTAAKTNLDYDGIPLTVERLPDSPDLANGSGTLLNFRLRVPVNGVLLQPGQKTLRYEIAMVALTEKGTSTKSVRVSPMVLDAAQTDEALAKGWRVDEPLPELDAESVVAVRYVIRDSGTGRIGSLTVPVVKEGAK